MKEYKNKKCLVTGGTGLIGRAVVDLLVKSGACIIVPTIDLLYPNPGANYVINDLRNWEDTKHLVSLNKYDYVFHLAGVKASPDITNKRPATMSIPPLQMNTNVLEACRMNGIKNVLFTSSIGAYSEAEILTEENAYKGEPMDKAPGRVKRVAEEQIGWYKQEFVLDYKIVRLANVYGKGDNFDPDNAMFIPSLMAKILRGDNPVIVWGDGSANRDFVYADDVARGIVQMMINQKEPLVNLGSGSGFTVLEVVKILKDLIGFEYKLDASKPSGVAKRVMNIARAKSYGYKPQVTLRDGLKETWRWFKENPQEHLKRQNYFKEAE